MDWVYDYQVCDVQREPTKVFKYSSSETKHSTTVVRVEPGNESKVSQERRRKLKKKKKNFLKEEIRKEETW